MKIITTVGTSVFENFKKNNSNRNSDKTSFIDSYSELRDRSNPFSDWNKRSLAHNLSQLDKLKTEAFFEDKNASAEIKSIAHIVNNNTDEKPKIYLLATDTVLSYKAAQIIKEWLVKNNVRVENEIKVIEGLSVEDANLFVETGLHNLVDGVLNISEEEADDKCILNISGGFKAMIPVLTIVGQLYNMPLFYIYENSDTPIELQRMPISFDWDVIAAYSESLAALHKVELHSELGEEMEELHLVSIVEDAYKLTVLGELLNKFLLRKPPHFDTVFGYFVEYKVKETFDKEFGCTAVLHGQKFKSVQGDLDIIVKKEQDFDAFEIKNLDYFFANTPKASDYMEKFAARIAAAENEFGVQVNDANLMVYSFKKSGDPAERKLTEEKNKTAQNLSKIFEEKLPHANFKVIHFYVKPNKIKKGTRVIYQDFLKDSLKHTQIHTIFPPKQKK